MKILAAITLLFAALGGTAMASSIAVAGAWSRPADATGVVYLTITNTASAPDRLLAATSPVASAVELHESTETKTPMSGMSGMSGMAMSGGVASMHPVKAVPVPARGTASLSPGGYHMMLIGLHHPLHARETFPVRLHFARAGWVAATVTVRAM